MMENRGKTLSRRALLFGQSPSATEAEAPDPCLPWASRQAILSQCVRCGDCVAACPEQIIRIGRNGFPTVDFTLGECSFCQNCSDICKAPVFVTEDENGLREAWDLKAQISEQCLSFKGVACQTCQDHCDARAIRFRPRIRSVAIPVIEADLCTGCGACVATCPVGSLNIRQPEFSTSSLQEVTLD